MIHFDILIFEIASYKSDFCSLALSKIARVTGNQMVAESAYMCRTECRHDIFTCSSLNAIE